jgi:uncharacterized UBP type Zn finger protein
MKPIWNVLKFGSANISDVLSRTIADLKLNNSNAMYPVALVSESKRSVMPFSPKTFEDAHEFLLKLCTAGKCNSFDLLVVNFSECRDCKYFVLEDDVMFGLACEVKPNIRDSISSLLEPRVEHWLCPGCHKNSQMSKTCSILEDPSVLVIQLKRFACLDGKVKKLSNIVKFPLIDLNVHHILYKLAAVVNHVGSLSSGHYTSYVFDNGQWFLVDDNKSSPVDSLEVCSSNAYILIYQICE